MPGTEDKESLDLGWEIITYIFSNLKLSGQYEHVQTYDVGEKTLFCYCGKEKNTMINLKSKSCFYQNQTDFYR